MRRIHTLVTVAAAFALTAACTGDDPADLPESDDGDARIVEHSYGQTEIEGTPERVVSLGLTDADPLLALGVTPVAIRPGHGVEGLGPWAKGELGGATPKVLDTGRIDVDAVAALKPDLIVAVSAEVARPTYDRLSEIAPTVVRPEGAIDYGTSWEVATTMIGDAVGEPEDAETIVEDTKVAINETIRENPRIDGTTGVVVSPDGKDGWQVSTPVDSRGQFMFELGSNLPPDLAKRDDGMSHRIHLSAAETDDLEADVVLAVGDPKEQKMFARDKRFQRLAVAQRGGVVDVPAEPVGQSLSYTTVLSIPYALDHLAPRISDALD
ncbi:MAG: ABC transporter substrate-binding protein [Nocardioidaceae bacterium]